MAGFEGGLVVAPAALVITGGRDDLDVALCLERVLACIRAGVVVSGNQVHRKPTARRAERE
jgi:hypothetical protein